MTETYYCRIKKTQENLIFQLAKKVLKEKGILFAYTMVLDFLKKENSKVIKDIHGTICCPVLD